VSLFVVRNRKTKNKEKNNMSEIVNQNQNQNTKQGTETDNQNNNTENKQNFNKTPMNNTAMISKMAKKQIYDWIITDPYREMLSYVQSRVMGQEDIVSVVTNIYTHLRRMIDQIPNMRIQTRSSSNNMLLCAPSGCGKTETYRAIKDYFADRIPLLAVHIVDVSSLTPAGFRGSEPSSVVAPLVGYGSEPIAIVFMDEFDKICTPSYTADHSDMHLEVQHNILTMVEGSRIETARGVIDTKNILFIGAGSFDSFRKVRESNEKSEIGFQKDENKKSNHYAPVTRENIITAGGCYELIGRFSYIVNYHPLNKEIVLNIINRNRELIANDFGCELILERKVLNELCEQADSKFGCRLLDSLMRDPVLKAYGDALQSDTYGDVLVITLKDLGTYSYDFRDYTPEEMKEPAMEAVYNDLYNSAAMSNIEQQIRMNFEELLTSILGKNSK
jgi:ATP-dependent protease Clp ATPase subunit